MLRCTHHELDSIHWITLPLHVPIHHHFHLSLPTASSYSGKPVKHFTSMVSTSVCGETGDLHVHPSFLHMTHSTGSISFFGITWSDGLLMLSRQDASTVDRPNKDSPCCLGQRRQQAKPEATAHQRDQTISSWG